MFALEQTIITSLFAKIFFRVFPQHGAYRVGGKQAAGKMCR